MKTFNKAPLAMAVTALMVAPYALADGDFDTSSTIDSEFYNEIDVALEHNSTTNKNFDVDVSVNDPAETYSGATVDSKQFVEGNGVTNQKSTNDATVGASVGAGSSGNIGINVAAGDNNSQANDAALASSDAADVFGQSAAYSAQSVSGNVTHNYGSPNNARVGGSTLQGATGNVGLNVAAGVGNAQQNSLAASSNESSAGHTRATVGGVQQAIGNTSVNAPHEETRTRMRAHETTFEVDATNLVMDQEGDLFPDTWGADVNNGDHSSGPRLGHFDLDTGVQYQRGTGDGEVPDYNDDGGALAFRATDESVLSGTITGRMPVELTTYTDHSNDATLGGNALQNASGNIGVNVAAGTNNMQRNSLSISSSVGGTGGTTPGNGGG
ncbi:hypothetical protein OM427_08620 [Halomonas sp. 18H]|uniref:hypothetical protein n=1 Tax=Halomonas almeriensis TaxID=308163 RepID=UPI002230262A|nr:MULTISPECIES: hypothetical protein [Halomonas]MCW4149591.1 hypothetical protein [Halomonas sp. 18H]MDN3553463.1 hypothetical protein [Halomonas almeriensis]